MKDLTKIKLMLLFIAVISCFALLFSMITIDVKTEPYYKGKIINLESGERTSIESVPENTINITCTPNVHLSTYTYYGYPIPEYIYVERGEQGLCVLIIKSEKTIYDGRWKWEK